MAISGICRYIIKIRRTSHLHREIQNELTFLGFLLHPQHVVVICKFITAWFVPSAPMQVKNDRLFDKLNRLKEELR